MLNGLLAMGRVWPSSLNRASLRRKASATRPLGRSKVAPSWSIREKSAVTLAVATTCSRAMTVSTLSPGVIKPAAHMAGQSRAMAEAGTSAFGAFEAVWAVWAVGAVGALGASAAG